MARPSRPCSVPGCPSLRPCAAHPIEAVRFHHRQAPKGTQLPRRVVAAVIERDGGICQLCGQPGADTADHVLARALGGTDDLDNLQAAHGRCNRAKAGREASVSRARRAGE